MKKNSQEAAIRNVIASMEIEGFVADEEDISNVRGIIEGRIDAKELDEKLFERYRELAKAKRTHRLS